MLMHVFLLRTPGWISYKCSWKTTLFLGICCRLVCFFPADSSTTSNHRPKPTIKSVTSVAESFYSAKKKKQHKVKTQNSKKTETDLVSSKSPQRPKDRSTSAALPQKSPQKKKNSSRLFLGKKSQVIFEVLFSPPKKNRSEALSRKSVERARKIPPNSSSICFGDLLFGKWVDYK